MSFCSDKISAHISFECPFCKQHLKAPPEMADDSIECPACHKQIQVPKKKDQKNKALFCALAGLAAGAIVVCFYYNTLGKIHITETIMLTNYVIKVERQTNWINKTCYISETNFITETNIVVKTKIVEKPIFLWTEIKLTNNAYMKRKVYQ